jgi:hypothetical protein
MDAWLSLPEEDGGIPFALRFRQGAHTFLVLGITGRSIDVMEEPEDFSPEQHRLVIVPTPIAASFLRRGFTSNSSEEWILIESLLPQSATPISFPPYDHNFAQPTHRLRAPESGAYYPFASKDVQEASAAILMALQNPHAQNQLIQAAVDTLASLSLTLPKRISWTLAMEAVAILARIHHDDDLAQRALQTAAGIQEGIDGANIPFVRDWADQTLQSVVALARVVEKAKHIPSEPDTSSSHD